MHVWKQAGWITLAHILNGTGHCIYSTYMQWAGEGQLTCPQQEEVTA
jgi:hypothetical protein